MKYSRKTKASADTVIEYIKRYSAEEMSWFKITSRSFWLTKYDGLIFARRNNVLFLRMCEEHTFGFSAPRRYFRLQLTANKDGTTLVGKWHLSDYLAYMAVGLSVFGVVFVKNMIDAPDSWLLGLKMYLFNCICYLMICWLPVSLIGILAFRKDERLMIKRLDKILDGIEDKEAKNKH